MHWNLVISQWVRGFGFMVPGYSLFSLCICTWNTITSDMCFCGILHCLELFHLMCFEHVCQLHVLLLLLISILQEMMKARATLPIANLKNQILHLLKENDVIVISGETGCGKTTQVSCSAIL